MKTILLLLAATVSMACRTNDGAPSNPRKTSDRTVDELMLDYAEAIHKRDTALLADCFHSSVFSVFQTSRQQFSQSVIDAIAQTQDGLHITFERAPYHKSGVTYKDGDLEFLTISESWKITMQAKKPDAESLGLLSRLHEIYQEKQKLTEQIYRAALAIPEEVKMLSLDSKKGELRLLNCEVVIALFEESRNEWRLVPHGYSLYRSLSTNK